jgi:hypothetical protein
MLIILIACVPVIGTVAVVVSTGELDLGDLKPLKQTEGNDPVLEWTALRRDHSPAIAADSQAFSGARIRALGYMTDGDRAGDFVLLRDAGNLLHPAHRLGDQMIAIRLQEGERMRFSPMELVWVAGILRVTPGDPAGPKPLYALVQARSQRAEKADLQKYFSIR